MTEIQVVPEMSYPKFSPKSVCHKCGHDDALARYKLEMSDDGLMDAEYIERTCNRCRYQWRERCIDAGNPCHILQRKP